MILGYKSVNHVQRVRRNIPCSGEQDDGSQWPQSPHFNGNFLPVHLRHEVFNDHNVNRVFRSQFKSLATTSSSQNGITEALEERFLAFQYFLVIVDAKEYCSFEFRNRGQGHGSPSGTNS
jgi:hypothetical protein